MKVHFLHAPSFFRIHIKEALDIGRHPPIDQVEEPAGGRVKAIVEVEDPVANVGEARVHKQKGPSCFAILSKLKGFDNHKVPGKPCVFNGVSGGKRP